MDKRMNDDEWGEFYGRLVGFMEMGILPGVETVVALLNEAIAAREFNRYWERYYITAYPSVKNADECIAEIQARLDKMRLELVLEKERNQVTLTDDELKQWQKQKDYNEASKDAIIDFGGWRP